MNLLRRTWRRWRDEQASRQGAALAFYALFSLAPLLVITSWLAEPLLGDFVIVRGAQLGSVMPEPLVKTAEDLVTATEGMRTGRGYALALLALMYAPLRGFLQLQGTLNELWGVRAIRGPGLLNMVRRKLLAFASVGTTGALLMFGVLVNGVLLNASQNTANQLELSTLVLTLSDRVGGLILVFFLMAIVFKTLPDANVGWVPVLAGAALTALMLIAGRELFAAYLPSTSRTVAFGAAASMVAVLLFAYYACQVVLFGATFAWVLADERGEPITPGPGAVRLVKTRVEAGPLG